MLLIKEISEMSLLVKSQQAFLQSEIQLWLTVTPEVPFKIPIL